MAKVVMDGNELEYNEAYWELIDLPEEFKDGNDELLPKSLHYVGPVVDGAVVEEFPWFEYPVAMYKTFAGVKGLTKSPKVRMKHAYCMFEGCSDFADIEGAYEYYHRGGGCAHSALFEDADIPGMLGNGGYWLKTESEILAEVFGVDSGSLLKVLDSIPVQETKIYFESGAYLQTKVIHKASEIKEGGKQVFSKGAVCSVWSPIRIGYNNVTIYFFADDFVNDIDDKEVMQVTGFVVNDTTSESFSVGRNATVTVNTDCIVTSVEPPINCCGTVTIKGTGQTLTLVSKGANPCIGPATWDGMSYGRWEPSRERLGKIVLDGVHVVCKNEVVSNFSIGRYGTNDMPEIELKNGATLDCPEMKGERVMVKSGAEGLCGSTKRSDPAVYELKNVTKQLNIF